MARSVKFDQQFGRNRGFKESRRIQPKKPKAPGTRNPKVYLPGVPGQGRVRAPGSAKTYIWPAPPPWWQKPLGEWIVYWFLKYRLHFIENKDFYYQARLYTDVLFSKRNFTEADFLVDLGPTSRLGPLGHYRGLVLDPYTEFTHVRGFDLIRRAELEQQGYLLIFIETQALMTQTEHVMQAALKGRDLSNRGYGV